MGGGFGIVYMCVDDLILIEEFVGVIVFVVVDDCVVCGIFVLVLLFEFGCVIVGIVGVMFYEVGIIKDVMVVFGVVCWYVSVDGGMSDNVRLVLYGV